MKMTKETVFDKLEKIKLYLHPEDQDAINKINEVIQQLGKLDKILWILVFAAILMSTYALELKMQGQTTCAEACPKLYPNNYAGYSYGILGDCNCYYKTTKIENSTLPNLTALINQTEKSVP